MPEPRIVVLGAGPTGLGAAWRLHERGHTSWELFEAQPEAGGLASSVVDAAGFTWDLGGHVLFSHYPYFDQVVDRVVPAWVEHEREAWVWMRDRWIPYPLQNNLWRLPPDDVATCVDGLRRAQAAGGATPASFDAWLQQQFGDGLCELFLRPYNRKVWAYDPRTMDVGWMGERVAVVDLARVLANIAAARDEVGWGPNATFRFPRTGGTGAIWKGVAAALPEERLHFRRRVTSVDPVARTIAFSDGTHTTYDRLISTLPLDALLRLLVGQPALRAHADRFVHSSSHIIGIGIDGPVPDDLRTKCWMYFPESSSPFYRCTVFSNYAPDNVPRPGEQWSLMAEVSESPMKPVDASRVVDDTIEGMVRSKLIPRDAPIVTRWHTRLLYGYPTPWLGRDRVLSAVQPALEALGILSRGRFGAWKYEVSNQDHSLMQGVQAVDRWLDGTEECVVGAHS